MDTLPLEVIQEIFLGVIEKNPHPNELKFGIKTIPLTLSHVCRLWRSTSISFGTLWSFLSLRFRDDKDDPHKLLMQLDLFETCLRRTNGYPLNFSMCISIQRKSDCEEQGTNERISCSLLSEQQRWQDVNLLWTYRGPSAAFRDIRVNNMPLLRSLRLQLDLLDERNNPFPVVVDIAKSSCLICLDLEGRFILKVGTKPIHTMTGPCALYFTSHSGEGLGGATLNLLKSAPNLKQFEVRCPDKTLPALDEVTRDAVQHNLRSLSFNGPMIPSPITKLLTLPSLRALRIKDSSAQLLLHFVQCLSPSLTFLEIEAIKADVLISTLHLLPTLRDLRIGGLNQDEVIRFLQELTSIDNDNFSTMHDCTNVVSRTVCPLLHSVSVALDYSISDADRLTAMCLFVESRYKILKPFKRVRLSNLRTYEDGQPDVVIDLPLGSEGCQMLKRHVDEYTVVRAEGDCVEPYPFYED